MSITKKVIETGRRRRRRHSDQFRAEAIRACEQLWVSVAAVVLARGLNANLPRVWVRAAERSKTPIAIQGTLPTPALESAESFVPVPLPQNTTEGVIRIDVRRNGRRIRIEWPAAAAHECALLMREIMK